MRLKYLFFCTASFFILSNYEILLTNITNQDIASDDFLEITGDFCDFLLRKYPPDKIILILNEIQKDPELLKTFIKYGKDLLNKQESSDVLANNIFAYNKDALNKDNIINIILNNKESEKFYANKIFWEKIKNSYFVLNTSGVLAIIIVVLYLLYLLYKWFDFEIPWHKHNPQPDATDNNNEENTQKDTDTISSETNSSQALDNKLANNILTESTLQLESPIDSQKQSIAHTNICPIDVNGSVFCNPRCCLDVNNFGNIQKMHLINDRQLNLLTQQIQDAKKIAIDTNTPQFKTTKPDHEQKKLGEWKSVGSKVLNQLEYAKKIGIIPVAIPEIK